MTISRKVKRFRWLSDFRSADYLQMYQDNRQIVCRLSWYIWSCLRGILLNFCNLWEYPITAVNRMITAYKCTVVSKLPLMSADNQQTSERAYIMSYSTGLRWPQHYVVINNRNNTAHYAGCLVWSAECLRLLWLRQRRHRSCFGWFPLPQAYYIWNVRLLNLLLKIFAYKY